MTSIAVKFGAKPVGKRKSDAAHIHFGKNKLPLTPLGHVISRILSLIEELGVEDETDKPAIRSPRLTCMEWAHRSIITMRCGVAKTYEKSAASKLV